MGIWFRSPQSLSSVLILRLSFNFMPFIQKMQFLDWLVRSYSQASIWQKMQCQSERAKRYLKKNKVIINICSEMIDAKGNTNPFHPMVFQSGNEKFHVFQFICKFPFPCSFSGLSLRYRPNFVPFQIKGSKLGPQAWRLKTQGCCSGCGDLLFG